MSEPMDHRGTPKSSKSHQVLRNICGEARVFVTSLCCWMIGRDRFWLFQSVTALRIMGSQVTGGLEIPEPCKKTSQIRLFWRVPWWILGWQTIRWWILGLTLFFKFCLKRLWNGMIYMFGWCCVCWGTHSHASWPLVITTCRYSPWLCRSRY